MPDWPQIGLSALISGTIASTASSAALALLAKAEGKAALARTHDGSGWLPIYADYTSTIFGNLCQQVTKCVWFVAAYIHGVVPHLG
jgi:hypothetical protein